MTCLRGAPFDKLRVTIGRAPSPDCFRPTDIGQACAFGTQKSAAESACVSAARDQETCAQQTTGFAHYVMLLRAGSLWGVAGAWLVIGSRAGTSISRMLAASSSSSRAIATLRK